MLPQEVLRSVMLRTGTTQVRLARLSGMRQPSISQVLSGRRGISDEQLDKLLSCMGYSLRVVREPVRPSLTRSEKRSWRLHRQISGRLSSETLVEWTAGIRRNLERLESGVRGQPHVNNLREWRALLDTRDVLGMHRALTGLDRHSIEMREVSPFAGVLSSEERQHVVTQAG